MSTIDSHSSSTRNHTLMQDSAFYRSVFELVADALLLLRLDDGTIIDANPAASVLFGYEREDLVGREVEEFSVDPEATRAAIRAHAEYVAERVYRRKDGSTISVEITSKIIRLNSVLVALASFRDISPRLHQEAELRERERRHATLLANLPGIAYRCRNDRQWTMEFISEGCLALTGYQPRDFIENATLSYNDLIFPEDQDWLWNKWQTVLARRDVFRDEYRILTKTNEIKWVWEQGQGVFDASGNLLALEGFITDITVRKQAELVISQSEERLNAAQRISKTGSWERDLVLGFEHWTRELYRILDRDPALTVPSEQIFIEHVVSEDRDAVARVLREATMSTTDFSFECRIATQRKQIKQVRIDGWIHRDEDGNPVRSGGVVQDITEFHRIRESLRLHAEQLARSSASRDRLYSIIAHDLRSPFSGLLGFSELLLEDFANLSKDVMYSYVANIHRSSRQVYSLVENLLYWSRLHTDRMEMRPEPVHLASAVEDVINVHHGIAIENPSRCAGWWTNLCPSSPIANSYALCS